MNDRTPPAGELPRFYSTTDVEHGCCWGAMVHDREADRGIVKSRDHRCAEVDEDYAEMICAALNMYDAHEKAGSLV